MRSEELIREFAAQANPSNPLEVNDLAAFQRIAIETVEEDWEPSLEEFKALMDESEQDWPVETLQELHATLLDYGVLVDRYRRMVLDRYVLTPRERWEEFVTIMDDLLFPAMMEDG